MTTRRAIVIIGGRPQQLPAGDALPFAALDGGGASAGQTMRWNGAAWVPFTPVSKAAGITVQAGAIDGPVLAAGFQTRAIVPATYALSGNWYLRCDPIGALELDVWVAPLPDAPTAANSIVGGHYPLIAAGSFGSGNFAGWTPDVARGRQLTVTIRAVSDVRWFNLLMEAER